MSGVLSVLVVAAIAYIGMSAAVFFRQPYYVYMPDRTIDMTPSDVGIAFERVRLSVADGETVTGWFVPAGESADARLTVLFLHGNGGDMGDRLGYVRTLHENGFDLMMIDYRGYGESTGDPSETHTYEDAMAAWRYVIETRGTERKRVLVLGRSLGGAVASWLAAEVNPGGLVIESSFTSAAAMAAKMFPFLPVRFCCSFKYDSLSRMAKIRCPVLVGHSRKDAVIPFALGRELFLAAHEPKFFVELHGSHNESGLDVDVEYLEAFKAFAKEMK